MPVAWYRTYQGASGKTGRVFTTTHGASEDLLNDGFRRMAVNATLWAAGLEASIRPDGDISFVGPYQPDDVHLRRVRQGREAVRHGGLGLADSSEEVGPPTARVRRATDNTDNTESGRRGKLESRLRVIARWANHDQDTCGLGGTGVRARDR